MQIQNKFTIPAILSGVIFTGLVYMLGYQTPREDFSQFIFLYFLSFGIFYFLWLNRQQWKFGHFFVLAVALRLVLLIAAPELSNDFYRFIWDGELITRGVNPYAHTPNELISQGPFYSDQYMRILYHGMGEMSQDHYSCYPVFNQLLFYLPAAVSDSVQTNVILLKLIILIADIGTIMIGSKILELLKLPRHNIWLYALNPFIILEFSGNMHFEGVMIFFVLLSVYYILLDKWLFAAVFFALAVHVKLIPLLLIPFVFKKMKWRRSIGFTALVGAVVLLFGMIMLTPALFKNFMISINLYTMNFEFNASVFYLFRELSLTLKGYDQIAFYGPLLAKLSVVLIALLALIRSFKTDADIFYGMMFALVIYYVLATTVHPWYISLILMFSVFTRYKFALVWSLLVMLSYAAYENAAVKEDTWLLLTEYVLLFGLLLFEIFKHTKKTHFALQLKSFFTDK